MWAWFGVAAATPARGEATTGPAEHLTAVRGILAGMRIYMDYNATAPLAAEAAAAMSAWLEPLPANPSAVHRHGQRARAALELAREQVAILFGDPRVEVVFTSGGTEADNLALWGLLGWPPRGHLVISAVEHPAILEPAAALEGLGVTVTRVPVDGAGRIDPRAVAEALTTETRLVSVMAANNEVGTLQPVAEAAALAAERGVPLHCDAVQAAAWQDLSQTLGETAMVTLAAHKIGGPVGIGALVLRRPMTLQPLLRGGGQQRGRRPGTETTALAVGFGAACARAADRHAAESVRVGMLAARLADELRGRVEGVNLTVGGAPRLPNTLHVCFDGVDAATLVARLDLDGLEVSAGSACASGMTHASHVLQAMRLPARLIAGAVRLSLGYETTEAEVERAVELLQAAVPACRTNPPGAAED